MVVQWQSVGKRNAILIHVLATAGPDNQVYAGHLIAGKHQLCIRVERMVHFLLFLTDPTPINDLRRVLLTLGLRHDEDILRST